MDNDQTIEILKKKIQKSVIRELCRKDLIDFSSCNHILNKLDEDIIKLESKLEKKDNMVIKIPI